MIKFKQVSGIKVLPYNAFSCKLTKPSRLVNIESGVVMFTTLKSRLLRAWY